MQEPIQEQEQEQLEPVLQVNNEILIQGEENQPMNQLDQSVPVFWTNSNNNEEFKEETKESPMITH